MDNIIDKIDFDLLAFKLKMMENNSNDKLHVLTHQPEQISFTDVLIKRIQELEAKVASLQAQLDKVDVRTDHMTILGSQNY